MVQKKRIFSKEKLAEFNKDFMGLAMEALEKGDIEKAKYWIRKQDEHKDALHDLNLHWVYNVESACASSSAAFNLAWTAVAAGVHDCALIVGCEKLYDKDKVKSFKALGTGMDLGNGMDYFKKAEEMSVYGDKILAEGCGEKRSVFMDMYSFIIKHYMRKYGLTQKHFAMLAVKAHKNGALNPHAQYQQEVTLEEVLNSGDVA